MCNRVPIGYHTNNDFLVIMRPLPKIDNKTLRYKLHMKDTRFMAISIYGWFGDDGSKNLIGKGLMKTRVNTMKEWWMMNAIMNGMIIHFKELKERMTYEMNECNERDEEWMMRGMNGLRTNEWMNETSSHGPHSLWNISCRGEYLRGAREECYLAHKFASLTIIQNWRYCSLCSDTDTKIQDTGLPIQQSIQIYENVMDAAISSS